jgi:predicted DNA-binding protein
MPPKRKTYHMRASLELDQRLQDAIAATGATESEILQRCVERTLKEVTLELARERATAASAFLREHGQPQPMPPTPTPPVTYTKAKPTRRPKQRLRHVDQPGRPAGGKTSAQ